MVEVVAWIYLNPNLGLSERAILNGNEFARFFADKFNQYSTFEDAISHSATAKHQSDKLFGVNAPMISPNYLFVLKSEKNDYYLVSFQLGFTPEDPPDPIDAQDLIEQAADYQFTAEKHLIIYVHVWDEKKKLLFELNWNSFSAVGGSRTTFKPRTLETLKLPKEAASKLIWEVFSYCNKSKNELLKYGVDDSEWLTETITNQIIRRIREF